MNKADGYRFDGVTDQRSQEQTPDLSGGCAHQYRHQGREGFRDFRAASTITGTNGGCAQRLCHLPAPQLAAATGPTVPPRNPRESEKGLVWKAACLFEEQAEKEPGERRHRGVAKQ
jgi:hypothetical protein